MVPTLLTLALLDRLEACLRVAQPWTLAYLGPGLDEATVTERIEEAGLTPTPEAIMWWTWRAPRRDTTGNAAIGGLSMYTLEEGIARYRLTRELHDEMAVSLGAQEATLAWPGLVLPFVVGVGGKMLSMVVDGTGLTEVLDLDAHDYNFPRPTAPSVGTIVQWWIECFEQRAYSTRPATETAWFVHEAMPRDRWAFL